MGSKGGGKTTQRTEPWAGAQPYITEALGGAQSAYRNPPDFFPDQTFVGPNAAETGAWDRRLGYTDQVFGGAQAPQFGDLSGAARNLLSGGGAGGMAGALSPIATQGLSGQFGGGPDQIARRSFDSQLDPSRFMPGIGGPDSLGQRSFDPRLDLASFTPGFGQAGGLDARGAYGRMLAGQPDYAGAQGAIDAANQPLLRSFQQDVLPQIAGRSGISGHDTGAIKTLNRVLPELGERMSSNALSVMEGERQRALGAQERAAGAVSQGGFQGYGLGLQGAGQQLGANQAAQQYGTQQDLARAGLSQQFRGDLMQQYGLGLQGAGQQLGANQSLAQFGLQQDLGQAGLNAGFRNQLLDFGGLAGQLQGQRSQDMRAGASLWPQVYGMGQEPANQLAAFGGFNRTFDEAGLNDAMNRFNFAENQPMNMAQWYSNIANGFGGLGSTTTTNARQPINLGQIGQLGLGAAQLFTMSDRRLKHDIEHVSELPSGIPLYEFSYLGSRERFVGVMADEVREVLPDALRVEASGYESVNYAMLR